ncbi:MAG: helix-turn-helix transcriptional regulator [Lachnospiraceae bacterium]|nr:helix-turn-helix transcriptional regulator [Lachnospiraceae bacterium]
MLYTGKLLWNIRESLGISRKTLSEGLCSVGYLTHIENNKRDADKLLFESLYQRLGKYSGRFEMLLDVDEYERLEKRWEIYDTIDEGNYNEAKSKIDEYRKNGHSRLEEQYLCLVECEIMHRTGENISSCMDMIMTGLKITRSKFDIDKLNEYYLSRMEMLLIQQYVRYMELSGEEEQAIKLYKDILDVLEDTRYDRSERELLYRHVGYWSMKYYLRHEMYDAALEIAEKTYEYTLNGDFIMFLTELKEGIITCLERKGEDMSVEKKYIAVLNEFKMQYGVRSVEEFFPRYEEIDAYNVNEIISQRRKMLGITQAELAFGICDISTVSQMENNRRSLQKEKKEKLLQRVKLSGDKYVARIDTYDYKAFEKINEIRDSCNREEHYKITSILEEIQAEYKLESVNSRQFICATMFEYDNVQDNVIIYLNKLKEILNESIVDINKLKKEGVILFYNEWNLLRKIIICKKYDSSYDECRKYLSALADIYNEKMIHKNGFMYLNINNMHGDILGEMGNVNDANSLLHICICASVKIDMLLHIRSLSYDIAWNILEKKENISMEEKMKCEENLKYAYVIAELYKNKASISRIRNLCTKHNIILPF